MERPFEKERDWKAYRGSVFSSWLQEELVFVDASPYGGNLINSYCHGWSSTPAYIIRTFLAD